ncbi:hypothetical protein ElyMa_002357500 [Elysia marginata]|uniref:SAP domain-containing protein n=1 Tax=Elysia marginata TaxID=1093978 RepID=A0AAV4GAW5_9GAST|nr:hypothetical protein ElyMa_002357500 [Elysia marginata]
MRWLDKKTRTEQERLLGQGRKVGRQLRKKYKEQEELVKLKIREKLVENERKKHEKELKDAQDKQEIIDKIMQEGVCKSKKDVQRIETAEGLKLQLRYHKVVLGKKDLLVSGTKEQLRNRLEVFLEEGRAVKRDCPSPPTKKRKIAASESDSANTGESDDLVSTSSESDDSVDVGPSTFKFKQQGTWVAVFYDIKFYIGQVLEIVSPEKSIVKFMTDTKCHPEIFKWPQTEDIAEVEAQYVFRWDFAVLPASNNFRMWQVPEISDIARVYQRLKHM